VNRRTFLAHTAAAGFSTSLAAVAGLFNHDTPRLQENMVKNIAFIEEQARFLA
jgi:hypothetical protein